MSRPRRCFHSWSRSYKAVVKLPWDKETRRCLSVKHFTCEGRDKKNVRRSLSFFFTYTISIIILFLGWSDQLAEPPAPVVKSDLAGRSIWQRSPLRSVFRGDEQVLYQTTISLLFHQSSSVDFGVDWRGTERDLCSLEWAINLIQLLHQILSTVSLLLSIAAVAVEILNFCRHHFWEGWCSSTQSCSLSCMRAHTHTKSKQKPPARCKDKTDWRLV